MLYIKLDKKKIALDDVNDLRDLNKMSLYPILIFLKRVKIIGSGDT